MATVSRRKFIGAAAGSVSTAASYSRILGANDRIQIAQLGCGHRAGGHRAMLKLSAQTDLPPCLGRHSSVEMLDLMLVGRSRPS